VAIRLTISDQTGKTSPYFPDHNASSGAHYTLDPFTYFSETAEEVRVMVVILGNPKWLDSCRLEGGRY